MSGLSLTGPKHALVGRVLLVLVGLSPFLPRLLAPVPGLSAVGELFERWFEFQCHRETPRSWALLGQQLPVCTRCFGIYLGLGLGALILRPKLEVWPLRIWVGVAALVMILDVLTENLGMRAEWAPLRFVTGVLLAYPVGAAVVRALAGEGDVPSATPAGASDPPQPQADDQSPNT